MLSNQILGNVFHSCAEQHLWSGLGASSAIVSFKVLQLQKLASVVTFTMSIIHAYPQYGGITETIIKLELK